MTKQASLAIFSLLLLWALAGCAVLSTPASFDPLSVNEVRFRDRAQAKADRDIRVSVAVPTADETRQLFRADLYRREI